LIRRRLNQIEFVLRLAVLMLPLLAFGAAAHIRFASGPIPVAGEGVEPTANFGLLLLTVLAWAVVVEHFDLSQVGDLFPRNWSL
jgi:hypothetical protein